MLLLLRFKMYTQTPRMARSRQTSVSIEKNACLYLGVAKTWDEIFGVGHRTFHNSQFSR